MTTDYVRSCDRRVSVLEPGCGTGRITVDLLGLPNVEQVVAWDVNRRAIAVAAMHARRSGSRNDVSHFVGPWCGESFRHATGLTNGRAPFVVVAVEVLFHLPDVHADLRAACQVLPAGTTLVGNLKTASGLLLHSALNRGTPRALARWALANSFHRNSSDYWGVAGHTLDQVLELLRPFQLLELRSDPLYHWFVLEV